MIAAALFAVACTLGGCAGGGATSGSFAMASAGGGPTVAFESIDGPPPQVFDRWSRARQQIKLRNLSIVSREGGASYRVRSCLSAQVVRGAVIACLGRLDQPAAGVKLRLTSRKRCCRAAANDLVLRKIAQAGLSGLSV
jgi:hypothetical protein